LHLKQSFACDRAFGRGLAHWTTSLNDSLEGHDSSVNGAYPARRIGEAFKPGVG
jgi:hypothetical protein